MYEAELRFFSPVSHSFSAQIWLGSASVRVVKEHMFCFCLRNFISEQYSGIPRQVAPAQASKPDLPLPLLSTLLQRVDKGKDTKFPLVKHKLHDHTA